MDNHTIWKAKENLSEIRSDLNPQTMNEGKSILNAYWLIDDAIKQLDAEGAKEESERGKGTTIKNDISKAISSIDQYLAEYDGDNLAAENWKGLLQETLDLFT